METATPPEDTEAVTQLQPLSSAVRRVTTDAVVSRRDPRSPTRPHPCASSTREVRVRQEKESESQGLESEGRLRASLAEGDRGASDYSCLQHLSTSDWGAPCPPLLCLQNKGLDPDDSDMLCFL